MSDLAHQRACPRCIKRGKTWEGDNPKCAFPDGIFTADNWNCATMNELRSRAEAGAVWSEDQNAAILANEGVFIVLSWYKRRGKTEGAWLLRESDIVPLSLDGAEYFLQAAHLAPDNQKLETEDVR